MANIIYSEKALVDLKEIGDYIEKEFMSPKAALNTVTKIQDSIDNLSLFPLMGTSLSTKIDIETDYRFLVCGKYLAFYRVNDEIINIDRIIYSKRDYIRLLFGDIEEKVEDEM